MKSLFITSSYPTEKHAFHGVFVEEFRRHLREASLVLRPGRGDEVSDYWQPLGVGDLPWLGGGRALADLKLNTHDVFLALHFFIMGIITTLGVCKRERPERILCFWAFPSAVFGLTANIVFGIPFDIYSLGSDVWKLKKTRTGRLLLRLLCKRARTIYADGPSLCADIKAITGRVALYLPLARELPKPLQAVQERDGITRFLFVGRYHENKGPDLLIKALSLMFKSQRQRIRVQMFGSGQMQAGLQLELKRAGLEGVVEIGEEIDAQHLSDWLASVDYLIIPSRIDSVPVIATDSVRADLPIIAMPVGDLPWLVNSYSCGILAESATASGLANAMLKAVFSAKRDDYLQGCRSAAKFFDIKKSAQYWDMRG